MLTINIVQLNILISQGSVATGLNQGNMFYATFYHN